MAPETVLGKRAGPIQSADSFVLDALQQLTASQNHSPESPVDQNSLIQTPDCNMPFHQAPYQPMQSYQQQVPMYPQSPPQDPMSSPQTPINDFGEKRRRVNGFAIHKSQQQQGHQQQMQQQPLTPQSPSSLAAAGIGSHAMPIPRQPIVNSSHRSRKVMPNMNTANMNTNNMNTTSISACMNSGVNTSLNTNVNGATATGTYNGSGTSNGVMSPPQVPAMMPGMPFIMDQGNTYGQSNSSTTLAPALAPTLAQMPTTVVTKPSVVPSLTYPPRPQRRAHQPETASPPQKPWKPQEIVLPKVVDVGSYNECDDTGGHYVVRAGEWFAGRYLIIKLLGQGTFGKVAQAWDERTRQYCAIKIIRAVPKYRDASKIELRVLSLISMCDPRTQMKCVRMRECFDYRNHVCIVTDLHDISVYDFLKENQFLPFPGHHIHHFAKQLLSSVAFIHSLGLVHTDLKPENVLLASSTSRQSAYRRKTTRSRRTVPRRELDCTDVTLIDFGSAIFDDEYHSSVVSTRHYRAPEIILGTGWSFPCDMWSIGCVLVELCTGRVLFETRNDLEHLHMMERTLGTKFSSSQLSQTANSSSSQANSLIASRSWPPKLTPILDQAQSDAVSNMQSIHQLVHSHASGTSADRHFWDGFLDLVSRLMALDPKQRITAQEALQHPWIVQHSEIPVRK